MQESEKDPALNDTERQKVIDALEAILATEKFDAAPQMSAFLRYVVEQAADGQQSRIKAFTVAVDALGKPETFDPQNDPVVRVLAGRLRAALTAYNNDHPNAPLVIKMTPGSYVPIFEHRANVSSADLAAQACATEQQAASPQTRIHQGDQSGKNQPNVLVTDEEAPQKINAINAEGTAPPNPAQPAASSLFAALGAKLSSTPTATMAGVVIAAIVAGVLFQKYTQQTDEPDIQAAMPTIAENTQLSGRPQPEHPSVFISAIDEGNRLENSLNAMVSGVISEDERVRVHRILYKQSDIRFWPEDYILTITVLDLPDETRVNLQLMAAITGQIIYSQAISLNESASEQLTQEELSKLTQAARLIVADDGPLEDAFSAQD